VSNNTAPESTVPPAASADPGGRLRRPGGVGGQGRAALLDVDGTLIDANYQHALAWYRAFRQHGIVLPVWRIHRHVGMGGDQIVSALAGEDADAEHGDSIRDARKEQYMKLIGELEPLAGARELIVDLKERGSPVVLASSSPQDEIDHYLGLLDARRLADDWTTSDDVEATKPEPDLVRAALDKAGTDEAVMVGDTPWDVKAASRAGLETVTVLTRGFSEQELLEAGAVAIFESMDELRERLNETPLGR
jgi:HAD superfamily hydrolase (TIGR01549 family)